MEKCFRIVESNSLAAYSTASTVLRRVAVEEDRCLSDAGAIKPYPYTLNLFHLFSDYNFAEQTLMKPANLVDITQIDDKEIKTHIIVGLLELAQKHIRDPDFSLVVNDLTEIITNIYDRFGSSKNLLLYVECTLYYIINVGNTENRRCSNQGVRHTVNI